MTEKKKKYSGDLTEKEIKIAHEVEEEAKKEIKEQTPEKKKRFGRNCGIASIVFGIIGLFLPQPFAAVTGFVALILTRNAITNSAKPLGLIGGILGFFNIISFVFYTGGHVSWLAT